MLTMKPNYRTIPSPERVANYLYLMILRKDDSKSGYRDRIRGEVSLIKRLSRKIYKKLCGHKVGTGLPGGLIPRYVYTGKEATDA